MKNAYALFVAGIVCAVFPTPSDAALIMVCQGTATACNDLCKAIGGSPVSYVAGINGDIHLCDAAAMAVPMGNLNPSKTLGPQSVVSADVVSSVASGPNSRQIPRCTSVSRGLANKVVIAPVDINIATRENLVKVPGITATAAQQIISERSKAQFANWDDVLQRAEAMRCIDFTGSPLRVMTRVYTARGSDPKNPGF